MVSHLADVDYQDDKYVPLLEMIVVCDPGRVADGRARC